MVSAKARVAVALAPVTQSEFVALVATLESLGALARFDLVLPALDVADMTARVGALLPDPHVIRIEPIHEYLRAGHDQVVLADDDPRVRGRSMASLLAATEGSKQPDPKSMTPPAVVAWLATAWSPMVPEPLQQDDVRQPANDGEQLVSGYADPAAVRFIRRSVLTGDVAVEIGPRTGAITVHMARATGPRGRVVAIAAAPDSDRLRACLALNGVAGWTEVVTTREARGHREGAFDARPDRRPLHRRGRLRLETPLEAARSALLEARVRKLLVRIAPCSLRPDPDAVRELFAVLRATRRRLVRDRLVGRPGHARSGRRAPRGERLHIGRSNHEQPPVNAAQLDALGTLQGGIPRVIHRIWLGTAPPERVVDLETAWREINPGWLVHTWREWDLPALRNQLWFDAAAHPAQRADIARLELLHRFGGVYVDTDLAPLRPIEPLIADTECFIGAEDKQWLGTAIIGSRPNHPFLTRLVDGIGASILSQPGAEPNEQTGPKYVTARHLDHLRDHHAAPVAVFPSTLFYPYHFSEPERHGGPFPNAYAVHEWSMSWTADGSDDRD